MRINVVSSIVILISTIVLLATANADYTDEFHDKRAVTEWVSKIESINKQPISALHLFKFKDDYYALTKPIGWKPSQPGHVDKYENVSVPMGFVTDLTSIPSIFFWLLRADGPYTHAAITHDFLYWSQITSKEMADEIFYEHMLELGIAVPVAKSIYWAVKIGGGSAWKNNAELKKSGERRILKTFPEDPRTTWEDWKKIPQRFAVE